jgi:hypothetical protein
MFLENKWLYSPNPESDHNASIIQPTARSIVSYVTGSGHVPPPSCAKAKSQHNYTSTPTTCLCGEGWHCACTMFCLCVQMKAFKEKPIYSIVYLKHLSMGDDTLFCGACRLTTELNVTDCNCMSAVSATIQSSYIPTKPHR